MGNGTGRGIAAGLAQGTENFLNSYLAVKRQQHEEKFQKLQPQIDLVRTIVNSPSATLNEKINAVNTLHPILGIKDNGTPLADQLGLTHLAQQQVQTQDEQPAENEGATGTIQAGSQNPIQDPSGQLGATSQIGSTIQTKKKVPAKYLMRGDLSDQDLAMLRSQQLQQSGQEAELSRQEELIKYQTEQQLNSLKAVGYTNKLSEGVGPDGSYQVVLANSAGDTKVVNLKNFKNIKQVVAEITGKQYTGKFGQLMAANQIVARKEQGDTTVSDSDYKGAKDFLDQFEQTGILNKANIIKTTNINTGQTPPSPAQRTDDERAFETTRMALEQELNTTRAKAFDSSKRAQDAANQAHLFYQNEVVPLQARKNKDDLSSDEEKQLQMNIHEYERLKGVADSAAAEDSGNKTALSGAQQKYQNHINSKPNYGSSSNGNLKDVYKSKAEVQAYADKHFKGDINAAIEYNKTHKNINIIIQ